MKKIYTLLSIIALSATAVTAQTNLITVNPGLETWTAGQPDGYSPYTGTGGSTTSTNNFLTQETTIKHGGASSARQQSQSGTQNLQYDNAMAIIPGHSYTVSYWFLDNDDYASSRIWCVLLDSQFASSTVTQSTDLQSTTYSINSPNWVNTSVTFTAPEGAAFLRFQARTYKQSATNIGGYIYYDDFSFVDNTPAGVNTNEIAGLAMYPNPVAAGAALNITSNSNAVKAVTVYDVLGKQVLNTTTANGTVNTGSLTAGIYMVRITEEGKTATKKLVVQ